MLSPDIVDLVEGGVSTLVATRDADLVPDVARVVGTKVHEDCASLTVFVAPSFAERTLANLAVDPRVAISYARAYDHRSFQIKGVARAREAREDERALVEAYRAAFGTALDLSGIPRRLTATVRLWPALALEIRVTDVFAQTPGPGAGARVAGALDAPRPVAAPPSSPATTERTVPLSRIARCFGGVMPGAIATCSADGVPNVSALSHVHLVDDQHLAVSCQFFNKTRRNLDENPSACVELVDPITLDTHLVRARFVRAETSGPLFDHMAARIEVIASHTGMSGIFRLRSADVLEVQRIDTAQGFVEPTAQPGALAYEALAHGGPMLELHRLQIVSDRINRAADLESLLDSALAALHETLGLEHSMVLMPDAGSGRLVTIASRGYGEGGIGAEVAIGEGVIGTAAKERRVIVVAGIDAELRYGRAVRDRAREVERARVAPEIPLPGLPDARSQLAIPLVLEDRLLGVLAVESRDPAAFERWHECFLHVIGNQIASRVDHLAEHAEDESELDRPPERVRISMPGARTRTVAFFRNDDCVFVDGEYLIRNVPGKILWKLLNLHARERRTEYTNRELRLDPWLGLPALKDNLESRLILLRRRLEQKCPEIRLVPTRRGRFALELDCTVELVEPQSA